MTKHRRIGILMALILSIATISGFAQPVNPPPNVSNLWYNEYVFLPGGFRGMAKTMAATNETFRLALRYIAEERAHKNPVQLPAGLTQSDISNAEYMVSLWPLTMVPKTMNFYGKVVDETGKPVADATAHFEWEKPVTNRNVMELKEWPRISTNVTTDKNGFFSFTGWGIALDVSLGKDGYYSSRTNRGAGYFKYSQPNIDTFYRRSDFYKPDSSQPVFYYLRKKGVGANALVTSQYGMRTGFWVTVPKDGTPVKVDLLHRKTGNGPLEIMTKKPEFPAHPGLMENLSPSDRAKLMSATNWSLTMRISDGGFIEQNDEFPFNPPESGYQSTVNYSFQKGQKEWTGNWSMFFQKNYYIKFGSPVVYGHLHLDTWADRDSVVFDYVINPDGSRNLESK